MYVIIKNMKNVKTGKDTPVILIDSLSEVLEFDNKSDAKNLCEILNTNTDSGHTYVVKKIKNGW